MPRTGAAENRGAKTATDLLSLVLRTYGVVRKDTGPDATGFYVSHCPPLDVYSQGRTSSEAIDNLVEACALTIEYCLEHNTLDAALQDCGFVPSLSKRARKPSTDRPAGSRVIEIPIPMKTKSAGCRAK